MARGRFFPNEDETTELIVCDGFSVPAGSSVTSTRELEWDALPFKPRFLVVEEAEDWAITAVLVGVVTQPFFDGMEIPALLLHPIAVGARNFRYDTVSPGLRVEVRTVNKSKETKIFKARFIGHQIIPKGHPDHARHVATYESFMRGAKKEKN